MENSKLFIILLALILIFVLINTYATFNIGKRLSSGGAINVSPEPSLPIIEISAGNSAIKGSDNAPITIVEFSDFECPFCGKFVLQTMPQIEEKYIKTGKVKMAFRHYPLPFHQYAPKASEASLCAQEQGKFWEYHDALFQNQKALTIDNLKEYAAALKLDSAKFNECLNSGKMEAEIKKDMADAAQYIQQYGLEQKFGTPAFFINGEPLIGAQPFSEFEKIIEKKLKGDK